MPENNILFRKNPWSDTDVEQHWDNVSTIYISENKKVDRAHNQRFTETVKYLNLYSNAKVLNISSRDCEAISFILKENNTVNIINAEISSGLIAEAKKIHSDASQIKIDSYSHIPFKEEEFDRIVCLETLEHVENPVDFLRELYRVSTKEARMVLSCPPLTSEIPYKIFTFLFGGHGEGPHRFLRSNEVKQLLKHTGWSLLLHKGTLLIPAGPFFLQRFGDWLIDKFQKTFISELGIRQFYVCEKK